MAYIVIALSFGLAGGIIGRIKGSSFVLWFLICLLVPLFGLLAAIFYRYDNRELRRRCPRCEKMLKLHDAKCMRCGEELEFPGYAIESEASAAERRRLRRAAT